MLSGLRATRDERELNMLSRGESANSRDLEAARRLFSIFGEALDLDLSVRLWDGSAVPLGKTVTSPYEIVVASAGVLSSLARRPTPENFLLHYANGTLAFEGGDPLGFFAAMESGRLFKDLRRIPKWRALRAALSVATTPSQHPKASTEFTEQKNRESSIRFHYDISDEFFALFLGKEMQYSCGYFDDPGVDLDGAQESKLESICHLLQLKRGDRLLDVGCGWGGLLCHAATRYGVRAHGLTLSPAQFKYTQAKINGLGLEKTVTVELCGYGDAEGTYDKIASIEMIEHVGLANYPSYLRKMRSLLRDRGLLLNQGTTRRAKRTARRSRRLGAGSRLMERYFFPGFELDHVGHTIEAMEASRFEIHRVTGWREHYARTTEIWCRRLWERRKEAAELVGEERTRLWISYLAGVSVAFAAGSLRVYQILASKQGVPDRSRKA